MGPLQPGLWSLSASGCRHLQLHIVCRIQKRIVPVQRLTGASQVREVDPRHELLRVGHDAEESIRICMVREPLETGEIFVAKDRRDENPGLPTTHKLSIHHDARDASISIHEGMHFGDKEHDDQGPRQSFAYPNAPTTTVRQH